MYRETEEILEKLGVSLDVRSQARGLTLAAQQTVEIAKVLRSAKKEEANAMYDELLGLIYAHLR
jgi:ABC-type sugar transport system ATPase subunit